MDYFLLSKISLRGRIFLGYFITALITVFVITLFYISLNNIFSNYRQLKDYGFIAALGNEISINMNDLERAVTSYLLNDDEHAADKIELIHDHIKEHLVTLSENDDASILEAIKTIEHELGLFHLTFIDLVKQRKIKVKLVNEELPKLLSIFDFKVTQINTSNPNVVQIKKDAYTVILMLEKSAGLYFSSYDSKHIKQTRHNLASLYSLLENIRAESKPENLNLLKEAKSTLQSYETNFLEAVQRTRGHLYLSNVVMAAAVAEAIYNADKLSDNINQSMLIIEQKMTDLFERMITTAQYISIALLTIITVFAYAVGYSIANPIKRITNVFLRLEKGDSTTPIEGYSSNDELGDLTHAAEKFREKNIQTEELLDKYRDLAEQLEEKVSERTAELEKANHQLEELSNKDGLTGLYNRRFFDNRFNQEWSRAIRSNLPLAIIMIDVDYFKPYNDHYGHQMGDVALINVVHTLNYILKRDTDCAARYGGEEFIVILQDTDLEAAQEIAEGIRTHLESKRIDHKESKLGYLTVSIGISVKSDTDTMANNHDIIKRADSALYESKNNGRNCITTIL